METPKRTLAKTISWQLVGIVTMTMVGLGQTGSLTISLSIAISGAATGTIMFYLHERLWAKIRWGCQASQWKK
ncbi:MAG: DUF2061 domain-containing protein [Pseudomonadota bacterium]